VILKRKGGAKMAIADSMKTITENIVSSYDERVRALGDLVADTHKTLEGFASNRKKMGKEQAETLSIFVNDLTKNVENMLKGFRNDHKQMSNEQAKGLADFVKNLTGDVSSMLNGFQKDRSEMSADLKKRLKKTVMEIESYTKNKLKEFSDDHADMSEELKKELVKFTGDIQRGVKKLLGEHAADMKEAANAWQGMSETLAETRKGRTVVSKVEAKVKVRPVEEAVEEEETSPEMELEEKVLKFIEKHPEGVRVSDMEEPLGVARTRLGVIAKRLLEDGRVRKEENMYFPL
jgi:F0F1-type ATP synthase membrane subunit b/b'